MKKMKKYEENRPKDCKKKKSHFEMKNHKNEFSSNQMQNTYKYQANKQSQEETYQECSFY
jgi:hypothetical protein